MMLDELYVGMLIGMGIGIAVDRLVPRFWALMKLKVHDWTA